MRHTALDAKRLISSPVVQSAIVMLAGWLTGTFVAGWLLDALNVISWRRPVQFWLTGIGLGRLAPYYAIFNLYWPDIFLALPAGLIIGLIGYRHWVRWGLLYAGGYTLIPWAIVLAPAALDFPIPFWADHWPRLALKTALAVAPIALLTASVASRGKRRREARRRAGACLTCGYDLRGNVSGRCPECGTPVLQVVPPRE